MIQTQYNTTDKRRKVLRDYGNTINPESRLFDKKAAGIAEYVSGEKPRNNKESQNLILEFINNVDVQTLMAVFTMFGTIITTAISLYRNLRKFKNGTVYNGNSNTGINRRPSFLFESQDLFIEEDILKFEPLAYIDIQHIYESQDFKNLNESEQMQVVAEIADKTISEVIDNDDLMFKFEGGAEMESLSSNKLSNINFSLRYHVDKTNNVDEFVNSIEKYLKLAEQELTDFDRESLVKHYNRYR